MFILLPTALDTGATAGVTTLGGWSLLEFQHKNMNIILNLNLDEI